MNAFRIILILSLSLVGITAHSQCEYVIKGKILDAHTREPIPFAAIQVEGTQKGSIADENGYFEIDNICEKEVDLIFSHIGYQLFKHHHDIFHDMPTILLAPDDKFLESVIIEGKSNTSDVATLKSNQLSTKEFEKLKSKSLAEVASSLTGVSILTTGQNIVKPIIHGLHSNRVLIINNGVRHEFQNWGAEHAPEIDPSQLASLSVVKGAATVRYGPDALGGVIIVKPERLELHSGLNASIGMQGNTNGKSGAADFRMTQGWDHFILGIGGAIHKQGDLSSPDYQLTNTGKTEYSYSSSLRYHKGAWDWETYYSHFYQKLGILRGSVNGNLSDLEIAMNSEVPPETEEFNYFINSPRQEVTHDLVKLKGEFANSDQKLSIQYALQRNQRKEFDIRRGSNNEIPSIDLSLSTHTLDLDWTHPSLGSLFGSIGIQGLLQVNENIPGTNTVPFVPNFITHRWGLYVIEQIEMGKSLFEAGLRYDYQYSSIKGREPNNDLFANALSFGQVTGSIGMTTTGQTVDFRTNLGSSWRPPSISELFSFGKHQSSIVYGLWRYEIDDLNNITTDQVLDQDLSPLNSEVGIKWINSLESNSHRFQWEITQYINYISNFINNRPAGITNTVRGAFPFFIFQQTDALFAGIDAALTLHPVEKLDIDLKTSYVWAKDTRNKSPFVEIPPLRTDHNLEIEINPGRLAYSVISLTSSYTFRYFQDPRVISVSEIIDSKAQNINPFENDNSIFDFQKAPDGYFLLGIGWRAGTERFQWSLSTENLLNKNYRIYTDRLRYFADQTGIQINLALNYILK